MTLAVMLAIAAGTVGALVLAVRLGRPDPQHDMTTSTGRLRLWSGVLAVGDQLKADVDLRSKQLVGRVSEAVETFRTDLHSKGIQRAEDAVKAVRKKARADLDDTWPWHRVRFDLKDYAEANILPLIVKRYDAFRQEMVGDLVKKLESAVGAPLEKLERVSTGVGTKDSDGSIVPSVIVGGAGAGLTLLGTVSGAAVALPVAAVAAAAAAGFMVKNYKSKEELADAAVHRAERMARNLFDGDGVRDPADGTLIPSATAWLERAANEMETRVIRRVEMARDLHVNEIERRTLELKQKWDANQLEPEQLRDPAFVAAALHPASREVARA